jgi:hypothetical protein
MLDFVQSLIVQVLLSDSNHEIFKQNNMKNIFTLMILAAAIAFAACGEDDNGNGDGEKHGTPGSSAISGKIDIKVENGASYNSAIDSVHWRIWNKEGYSYYTVAKAAYANGEFTLNLPASLPDASLFPFFEDGEIPDGVNVSNPNVKKTVPDYIDAYKWDSEGGYNDNVGSFYHGTANKTWKGYLLYVTGDVIITGSYTETAEAGTYTIKFNINAKKGWNILYQGWDTYEDPSTFTTEAPAGAKWYFESYGH